jgi:hypothetical protein
VLPLLRRTFGEFSPPERASIAGAARQLGPGQAGPGGTGDHHPDDGQDYDAGRAAGALATVTMILGGAR